MVNQLNVEQVVAVFSLIDTVKHASNNLDLFKEIVIQELDRLAKYKYQEDWEYVVENKSKEELQEMFSKALQGIDYSFEETITWEQLNVFLPDVSGFLENVQTFEAFIASLKQYIEVFPKSLAPIIHRLSYADLGNEEDYNKLPLGEAEAFINKFQVLYPLNEGFQYVIAPYDLNHEVKIAFETEQEAKEYADSIAPSAVSLGTKDNAKEIA